MASSQSIDDSEIPDLLALMIDPTELEELAAKVWPDVVSSIDALVARAEGDEWHAVERSALSGDNAATRPLSDQPRGAHALERWY